MLTKYNHGNEYSKDKGNKTTVQVAKQDSFQIDKKK